MFGEDGCSIKRVWGNPIRPSNTATIARSFFIKKRKEYGRYT